MGKGSKSRGIVFYTLIASVVIHAVLFWLGSRVRLFSGPSRSAVARSAPPVQARIEQLAEREPVTVKPRVKQFFPRESRSAYRPERLEVDSAARMALADTMPPAQAVGEAIDSDLSASGVPLGAAFFGQFTSFRKICYVVDCSGSMHGRFSLVRNQLRESIQSLQPDQYFYIIFFQDGDRLVESGDGRMVRATPAAKRRALDFIERIRPSGPTNAVAALRRAMEVVDAFGNPPEQVYFLTDGFDLETADVGFASGIEQQRRRQAPRTRINTIGFGTQPTDVQILEAVAAESGGEFTNVE